MVLYLCSRPEVRGVRSVALRAAAGLRQLTVRLPCPARRVLSWPSGLRLYGIFVVPGEVGRRHGQHHLGSLPLQAYRGQPWHTRWLDTFDRLSAPVEHRYTWTTLEPWFAGLIVRHAHEESG